MIVLEALFWSTIGLILYAYAVYPVVLCILARSAGSSSLDPNCHTTLRGDWPRVTLVIAAYMEEDVILSRMNNALLLDYPSDRLDIIVGVDGHEDLTGELIRRLNEPRITLMQFPERRGKTRVLNDCVPQACGDIIVFSDANTNMAPDAIRKLVRPFSDAQVGGVCGQLILTDLTAGKNSDGLYWRYENFLKVREGALGALLGVNGAIYAIRKDLYDPLPTGAINDDFIIGMRIHLKGKKLLYEQAAKAYEETAPNIAGEFTRRARIGSGGFQSLRWLYPLLSPTRGMVAFAFWSHKLLRWLCPTFMLTAMLVNLALITKPFYAATFIAQLSFYGLAWLGTRIKPTEQAKRRWSNQLMQISSLFVAVNAALFVGMLRALRSNEQTQWKRTGRSSKLDDQFSPNSNELVDENTSEEVLV